MSERDAGTVTVVVGCFEPLVGRGVVDVLREDRRLRIVVSDPEEAALERDVARQAPRVVILGETVEYASLARLRSSEPAPTLLVIAPDPARLVGPLLLAAGVSCLSRTASNAELLAAVHLVAGGMPTFFSADVDRLERSYPSDLDNLTLRETEVLDRLSEGCTNPEIADALHISVETARTHVARVFRKLNIHRRRDLIGMPVPRRKRDSG